MVKIVIESKLAGEKSFLIPSPLPPPIPDRKGLFSIRVVLIEFHRSEGDVGKEEEEE